MRSKFLVLYLLAALLCGTIGAVSAQSEGPQGLPDLVVQVDYDQNTGYANIRVRNVGSAYAGGFYTYLYIDPLVQPPGLTTPDTSYSFLFGLAAGQSYTWSYGPWTPTPGQHPIWAWVDRDRQVTEEDEYNNLGFLLVDGGQTPTPTATPTVTPTPGPARPLFLPLVMRGYIGTIIIPPGEATPTPTATPPVIYTPDSRTMVTTTTTVTPTP